MRLSTIRKASKQYLAIFFLKQKKSKQYIVAFLIFFGINILFRARLHVHQASFEKGTYIERKLQTLKEESKNYEPTSSKIRLQDLKEEIVEGTPISESNRTIRAGDLEEPDTHHLPTAHSFVPQTRINVSAVAAALLGPSLVNIRRGPAPDFRLRAENLSLPFDQAMYLQLDSAPLSSDKLQDGPGGAADAQHRPLPPPPPPWDRGQAWPSKGQLPNTGRFQTSCPKKLWKYTLGGRHEVVLEQLVPAHATAAGREYTAWDRARSAAADAAAASAAAAAGARPGVQKTPVRRIWIWGGCCRRAG